MTKVRSVIREQECVFVSTRKVKNDTMTLWDIEVGDGTKLTTFQSPLGEKAKSYIGQICDFQITIDGPNDKGFTNLYLEGVQRSPGVKQPSEVAQAAHRAQTAAGTATEVTYDQYKDLSEGQEQRKTTSIHRQTAAKVAAALLPESSQEFWTNVTDLVHYFATGENPFIAEKQANTASTTTGGTSPTPEPEWSGTEPDTDDDIPF